MTEGSDGNETCVIGGGITVKSLGFADDIDLIKTDEEEKEVVWDGDKYRHDQYDGKGRNKETVREARLPRT